MKVLSTGVGDGSGISPLCRVVSYGGSSLCADLDRTITSHLAFPRLKGRSGVGPPITATCPPQPSDVIHSLWMSWGQTSGSLPSEGPSRLRGTILEANDQVAASA